MNNPELWLLPIIVLFVWIVSSFMRNTENDKSGNRSQRTARGERPTRERGTQRSATDIDRFLEEVNRRRRQAAERPPSRPEPAKAPVPVRPQPASSTRPKPGSQRPAPQARPSSGRPVPTAQPVKPVPQTTAQRIAAADAVAILEVLPAASAAPAPSAAEAFPATGQQRGVDAASNATAFPGQLITLLQGPQSLATAVILKEIFGQPRCRRRRVR
jgi:FtsZ-interacting cell division protein ZipA